MLLLLLLTSCRDPQPTTCGQSAWTEQGGGDLSQQLEIDDPETLDGPVRIEIVTPARDPRYGDGAPVALFVHGGWQTDALPSEALGTRLRNGRGLVQLYLNLPGGVGPDSSAGDNDRRGASARAAVAAALRYAAGDLVDVDACTLDERLPVPLAPEIAIGSSSNGGNLAWNTLGDTALDLPEVVGIASFETPSAGQFVVGEPGGNDQHSPLHYEGACDLDPSNAIVCDYDYRSLTFTGPQDEVAQGTLFLDLGEDGAFDPGDDFVLGAVWSPEQGVWVHSLPARIAAEEAGIAFTLEASVEETAAFWREREAPASMAAAAERFPDLAGISIGTEVDHVLTEAEDHPHVTGMIAAMRAAGIRWTRLQPDAAYVVSVATTEVSEDILADLDANQAVAVGDTSLMMEPEDATGVRASDFVTAAVAELLDRSRADNWQDDLDAPLTE